MLNEDKIRLMTKAAAYESGEGKKALSMNKYFRGDYISLHLIRAWISFTAAFCICAGLWAFYYMEELMNNIHKMDLPALGKHLVFLYAALLALYLVINYIVYHSRYQRNKKGLAVYYHLLKRIAHIYQTENRASQENMTKGVKKYDDRTGI